MNDYIQQVLDLEAHEGESIKVEKLVSFFTSHDNAITETLTAAGRHVERYPDFAEALAEHESAWTELWDVCAIDLPSEPRVQLLLRFHTAHILQVCSRHTARPRRGRARAGAQRRGLPRPRVLGRALRLPVPRLPAARGHPRAADVPVPPPRRGPGGGRRGRLRGRDVPVAVRARTAPRRPRSSTSTRSRASGTPTTRTTSATSTPRSSTTSGSTTRPPTTWSSCATTAPS